MNRTRYHLSPHALEESIPLRFGRVIAGPKLYLENDELDEEATLSQRYSDRENGREHRTGVIWTEKLGGECLGKGRLVIAPKRSDSLDPVVVTLLSMDAAAQRTSQNLSNFLSNERKKSERDWLTPEYIATELHPLVARGVLSDQTHLADHIAKRDREPLQQEAARLAKENARIYSVAEEAITEVTKLEERVVEVNARALRAEESERSALQKLAMAFKAQQAVQVKDADSFATMPLPAKEITEPWNSKTGSSYVNYGLEAAVVSVSRHEHKTKLTYIDQSGKSKTIEDFGYQGFVEPVFNYLLARVGQRAVFLVTQLAGRPLRLAADTMMLPQYRALWD